jgi:SAM-dependent methyltransferase
MIPSSLMYEQIKEVVPRRYRYLARAAWCDVMSPLFAGDAVECPICEKASRRWISLGLDEGMCPRCMSEARHRLLALYMRDELEINTKPMRILHFAAEYCFIRRFRRVPNITHVIADLDPPRGGVKIDITDIPLESDFADLVICSHVLEHVEDDSKAMFELKRVLRPGGTALIMCPVSYELESTYEDPSIVTPEGRREAFHQNDHVRLYGADFDDRLRAAGFQVDASQYGLSHGEKASRFGLRQDEILYVCR